MRKFRHECCVFTKKLQVSTPYLNSTGNESDRKNCKCRLSWIEHSRLKILQIGILWSKKAPVFLAIPTQQKSSVHLWIKPEQHSSYFGETRTCWNFSIYCRETGRSNSLQGNLCQKLLFWHQLTHNMTSDCSWNYYENYKCRTCSVLVVFMVIPWTIFCHIVG